jgi:hypothetical protein
MSDESLRKYALFHQLELILASEEEPTPTQALEAIVAELERFCGQLAAAIASKPQTGQPVTLSATFPPAAASLVSPTLAVRRRRSSKAQA